MRGGWKKNQKSISESPCLLEGMSQWHFHMETVTLLKCDILQILMGKNKLSFTLYNKLLLIRVTDSFVTETKMQ